MKIELTCSICQAVLRVDEEHAGKQLRCPNCQGLTRIPAASNASASDPTESPSPDIRPDTETRYDAPMQDWDAPQPQYSMSASTTSQSSNDTISLVLGIIGIFIQLGCGCISTFVLILNGYGLYLAIKSEGNLRTPGIIANAIALLLGAARFLVMIFAFG